MSGKYGVIQESEIDQLYQVLARKENGRRVHIPSEDPFGLYSHVIKQFNGKINRVSDGTYEPISTNRFYSFWMLRWWRGLRADTGYCFVLFSVLLSSLVSLVPYVNLAHFCMWLLVYVIYEKKYRVHRTNQKLSDDPFKWMIHAPNVCEKAGLLNVYYDIRVGDIDQFGLKEAYRSMLKSRVLAESVSFMVYNDRFRAAWVKFPFLRVFHILQLLTTLGGVLFAYLWLYPELGLKSALG